jgi:hypothetical protein
MRQVAIPSPADVDIVAALCGEFPVGVNRRSSVVHPEYVATEYAFAPNRRAAYPYRHPFVTLHEVMHDGDFARLAEGQLMTPQMLIDLMAGLGRSVPAEILPARVLVRTAELSPPALAVQSVWESLVGSRSR